MFEGFEDANHKIGMVCSRYACGAVSVVDTEMGSMCLAHSSPLLFEAQAYPGKSHGRMPQYLPWEFVRPHNRQAWRNHSQSLARLSERQGLSVGETLAVLQGRELRAGEGRDREKDIDQILALLEAWRSH